VDIQCYRPTEQVFRRQNRCRNRTQKRTNGLLTHQTMN